MNDLCQFLALHGPALLLGSTGLLALGAAGIALVRSPIHRQRTGELTILAVLIWFVLACIPLPRFSILERFGPRAQTQETEGPVFSTPRVTQDTAEIDETEPAHLLEGLSREPALPTLPPGVLVPDGNASQADADAVLDASIPPFFASAPNPGPPSDSDSRAPWERRELFAIASVVGAFGCMAWLMLGRLLLVLLVWSGTAPEPWLRRLVESLPNPARTGRVRLVVSKRCRRAMSFGVWRPTIVLPGEACRPESSERLRHVLLHELAHVHKRDALGLGMFNLVLPLVYWNPLYWWICTRTRLAAELIADDWAAGHCDKEHYVRDLIALIKNYDRPRLRPLAGIGMFASRTQFYRRMKMLIERDKPLAAQCSKPWRVALAVLFLFTLALFTGTAGVRPAKAQASSEEPNAKASSEAESQDSSEDAKAIIAKLRKERDALRKELEERLQIKAAEEAVHREITTTSPPDGHYLVRLEDGELLNVKIANNRARCVDSNQKRYIGMTAQIEPIVDGIFTFFFPRKTQNWYFSADGSAVVKEVPDRGETQTAVPAKNQSLDQMQDVTRIAKEFAPPAPKKLTTTSPPDGHYLVRLEDGELLNVKIANNRARCVDSNQKRYIGMTAQIEPIVDGIFTLFFPGKTQNWYFSADGSAVVKEVPHRGETQTAVPVKNQSLSQKPIVKEADDSSSKARSGLFDPPQAQLEIVNLEKERNALREELQKLKTLVEQVRKETKERLKQKEKETATYPRLLPFSLLLGGGGEAV